LFIRKTEVMIEKIDNPTQIIEKKNDFKKEKAANNAENDDNFLKLIAEIIVEIIIKETSDERNRIRPEK
jgi:hypothetical protein